MAFHAVHRTSPMGEPFVGTCSKCGKRGITLSQSAQEECPNVCGTTPEQDLVEAIDPEEEDDPR